jgi:hypothetical protein
MCSGDRDACMCVQAEQPTLLNSWRGKAAIRAPHNFNLSKLKPHPGDKSSPVSPVTMEAIKLIRSIGGGGVQNEGRGGYRMRERGGRGIYSEGGRDLYLLFAAGVAFCSDGKGDVH